MKYPTTGMRRLPREHKLSALAIELGSPVNELLDVLCAFGDKRLDRTHVTKSGSRDKGVSFVKLGVVIIGKDNRNAALRVFGVRLASLVLRQYGHASAARSKFDRRPKTSHAAPNNDKVGFQSH